MKKKIGLAVAALLIAVSAGGLALAAQGDSDDDDDANLGVSAVQVQVGPFFSGYGLESGDPIAGARIAVFAGDDPNGTVLFEGVTDQDGRLALPVEPGRYRIIAEAGTSDPLCWWYGEVGDVELGQDTAAHIVDAGLMCE